jgi:hypothetical protein
MALNTSNLLKTMVGAAEGAFAGSWQDIKHCRRSPRRS